MEKLLEDLQMLINKATEANDLAMACALSFMYGKVKGGYYGR